MKKVLLNVLTIIFSLFVMCIGLYFFHERQIAKYGNYCINEIKTQLGDDIGNISSDYIGRTYAGKFLYSGSVTFDGKDYNFYCKVLLQNNKVDLELQEVSSKEFDEIQQSKVLSIEKLKETFTGNIINGSELEEIDITGDNTLYYNDKFGFAVNLGEQWKGGKIELKTHNAQFGENAISRSIEFHKEGFDYDVYSLSIDKIEKYDSMKKQDVFWTEDEFEKGIKGKNNKYLFVGYANDQLAPYIDTTNEYQQLFLDGFLFYDVNVEVEEDYKVCKRYFDGCNWCTMQDNGDYICTEEACEQHQEPYCGDEPVVEEPNISLIDQLKQSSENRINGKVDESLLTNKPNNIYFDITGDNTLYYNDEFGFSISLGKEWKGGKIENAYEGKYLASVWIRNEGLKTIGIFIIDNTTYQRVKDSLSSDGDEYIGNNNKYTFQRRIVENGEKLGEYKLHLYDVEEQETIEEVGNINSAFSEFEGYIKECENQITNSRIPDIDGNITNISYLRLNKMNVGNAYKITGTLTYDDNGKTNKKEINCALTLGDYSVFGNTTMYNAFGSITTKSEEEQKCVKSLEKYPIEQMKGDHNTVIDVACFPKDYYGPGFITGYVYTTKYSDLGLRITTPAGWRMMEPDGIFLTKSDKPIFVRKGNRISYFHPTVGEEMEYIEVYEKSKNESLEDIIKNKHLNKGCKVGKDIINYYHQNRVVAPYPGIEIFEPIGMSGGGWEGCIADNESQIDNGRIPRFFESPDKSKYYKLSMMDGCAPGPCSIFGKIELL